MICMYRANCRQIDNSLEIHPDSFCHIDQISTHKMYDLCHHSRRLSNIHYAFFTICYTHRSNQLTHRSKYEILQCLNSPLRYSISKYESSANVASQHYSSSLGRLECAHGITKKTIYRSHELITDKLLQYNNLQLSYIYSANREQLEYNIQYQTRTRLLYFKPISSTTSTSYIICFCSKSYGMCKVRFLICDSLTSLRLSSQLVNSFPFRKNLFER